MRLRVNEEKSGIRQPHQVHFLGFRFQMPADRGGLANSTNVQASGQLREVHTDKAALQDRLGRPML